MSPRANVAQLKHALENGEKLIAAKKMEILAYNHFQRIGEDMARMLFADPEGQLQVDVEEAIEELTSANIARAEVELEELQLTVRAMEHQYKQATSMISIPGQN